MIKYKMDSTESSTILLQHQDNKKNDETANDIDFRLNIIDLTPSIM